MSSDVTETLSLHWLLLATVFIAVSFSAYKYVIAQDYLFDVEAPCNAETHDCYVRDCEVDYCPPNGLTSFRVFTLPASQFEHCSDNSCLNICPSEEYLCSESLCADQDEVLCSSTPH